MFTVATEDSPPLFKLKKLFVAMHVPAAPKIKRPYDTPGGAPKSYIIDRSGVLHYAKAAALDRAAMN